MARARQQSSMFKAITSREEALKTIRDASIGFFVLAVIQGAIGIFMMPSMLLDAAILAVLAGLLYWLKSRIAACLLMVMASTMAVTTVLTLLGMAEFGGRNIVLAAIVFWTAIKAIEATFKLHGRFQEVPSSLDETD